MGFSSSSERERFFGRIEWSGASVTTTSKKSFVEVRQLEKKERSTLGNTFKVRHVPQQIVADT
jgi:signal-transduction protein with cAMP-binding, CBS, and nucleotidyltransferase domain